MVETYKGYKIKTRTYRDRDRFLVIEATIDGHFCDSKHAVSSNIEAIVATAKKYVDDSTERPEAYEWSRGEVPW